MYIHVRLRVGRDDDIAEWYQAQENKSGAVRKAIRVALRLQNGDTQEVIVREAVARELSRLPDVVAAAVRTALEEYNLTPCTPNVQGGVLATSTEPMSAEDPKLAARLDEQLGDFFGE